MVCTTFHGFGLDKFLTPKNLMIVIYFFLKLFFCCWFAPFGYLYFSYFSMNEPEMGAGIDHGMA
jgi:hypothetical protein